MADRQRLADLALTMQTNRVSLTSTTDASGRQIETPALLEARSLYRFFRADEDETMALQGVSLRITPGEVVAVAGPSGSGKSTLLACLAGLDEPSGGMVYVNSHRMSHQPEATRALLRARYIGVLSQSGNLFAHLTVVQNIRLAQSLAGGPPRQTGRDLLGSLGIAGRADAVPSQLSGGESARAGLAIALANDPAVIIADEPTGELDSVNEGRLLDLLIDRARSGRAVVVASHSHAVIRRADRVITLLDGREAS
jgi:putative ABC transport system ATP-binding protein